MKNKQVIMLKELPVLVKKKVTEMIYPLPDFPMDMYHCAENVFIKLTILVTPIKLYTKMFLIN